MTFYFFQSTFFLFRKYIYTQYSPISSSESESSSSFRLKLEVDDMKRDRLARFAALEVADEGDDLKDVLEAGGEAIGL